MAKAESIYQLARAALERNHGLVLQNIKIMASTEPESSSLKRRLYQLLERHQRVLGEPDNQFNLPHDVKDLVSQRYDEIALGGVCLGPESEESVNSLLDDYKCRSALLEHGLSPRNRMLLVGEPGTGKTSLACAVANELGLPCFIVNYGSLIDSHFGATGKKLHSLFRALSGMPCVIFLDEMETLLCERSRVSSGNEVGEVSRVVTTLLQIIDSLSTETLLFGATNHPDMLDKAVSRRFDLIVEMPQFTESMLQGLTSIWSERYPRLPVVNILNQMDISNISTPAELEREFLAQARDHVKANRGELNQFEPAAEAG